MKTLVIIANTPSPNTLALRQAVERGAKRTELNVQVFAPLAVDAEPILAASAIILGTTANFGYMSGALKDFFERIYYPCLERTQGLPMALYVRAGNDSSGAVHSVQRITTGLRWNAVLEPVIFQGPFQADWLTEAEALGEGMAEGVALGIF